MKFSLAVGDSGHPALGTACKVLIERRDACSDPDEAAFLTSVRGPEKAGGGAS
jgi:hypothetical protein